MEMVENADEARVSNIPTGPTAAHPQLLETPISKSSSFVTNSSSANTYSSPWGVSRVLGLRYL